MAYKSGLTHKQSQGSGTQAGVMQGMQAGRHAGRKAGRKAGRQAGTSAGKQGPQVESDQCLQFGRCVGDATLLELALDTMIVL